MPGNSAAALENAACGDKMNNGAMMSAVLDLSVEVEIISGSELGWYVV